MEELYEEVVSIYTSYILLEGMLRWMELTWVQEPRRVSRGVV